MNPLYSRHYALADFADTQQNALAQAKVLIVGCGGLGNLVAMYLCTAGVGRLVINDFDTVDITNLQRQILFQAQDIAKNKSIVAKEKLSQLNPACQVECITQRLSAEELITATKDCDLIIDCSDNFATRLNINLAAIKNKVSLVSGAAIRYEGQLSVYSPQLNESPCYQCLHQEENETLEDCQGNGILAPVTGVIASSMATEAIKLITKIGQSQVGRLQLYDARYATWREVKITKDPNCKACS